MLFTVVDHLLEFDMSGCNAYIILYANLLSFSFPIFIGDYCLHFEKSCMLAWHFYSTQNFDLVAVVVYHMITVLFSDENDGT